MLTFPVIPAKAGIQVPLEADIVLVRDSGLRWNDEIGLLNGLIIKCQHYLGTPAHYRAHRERREWTHQRFSCSSRRPGPAGAGPQTQHRQRQWSLRSQHRHEVPPSAPHAACTYVA